ncbi:MAG: hypothetical protein ACRCW9_03825 [Cetobacterium sp.]
MIANIYISNELKSALYCYLADKKMEILDFDEHVEIMDKDNKKLWKCYKFLKTEKHIQQTKILNMKFPYTPNEIIIACMWKKKGILNIC